MLWMRGWGDHINMHIDTIKFSEIQFYQRPFLLLLLVFIIIYFTFLFCCHVLLEKIISCFFSVSGYEIHILNLCIAESLSFALTLR